MDLKVLTWFLSLCSFGLLAVNMLTSADTDDVRLRGGISRCDGTLELKHNEEWRTVDMSERTVKAATVMCYRVKCGSVLYQSYRHSNMDFPTWRVSAECAESYSPLKQCDAIEASENDYSYQITCSESVRLVQGPSLCSGSLQLRSDQSWTSVCEEDFDLQDAEVVCRELGCGAPSLLQGALYGEGQAPRGQMFQCDGHESALMNCSRSNSTRTSCSSGKAVQLTCSEPIRLVGQPSRCAGTVELKHNGEWRAVVDWTPKPTDYVCQQLNCGLAVSLKRKSNSVPTSVWRLQSSCVRWSPLLRECVMTSESHQKKSGVEMVCSDLLFQPNISLSVSADGVSEAQPQGLRVLLGSDFSVRCSIEAQYPGGFFQLISPTVDPAQNHTLPAVNHSAHFLFSDAGPSHKGGYTCVYHLHVYSHNFSSQSHTLFLSLREKNHLLLLLVPAGLLFLLALFVLIICTKMKSNNAQRSTGNSGNNTEIAMYENVGQEQVPEDPTYQTLCPTTMDPVYYELGPQLQDSV